MHPAEKRGCKLTTNLEMPVSDMCQLECGQHGMRPRTTKKKHVHTEKFYEDSATTRSLPMSNPTSKPKQRKPSRNGKCSQSQHKQKMTRRAELESACRSPVLDGSPKSLQCNDHANQPQFECRIIGNDTQWMYMKPNVVSESNRTLQH